MTFNDNPCHGSALCSTQGEKKRKGGTLVIFEMVARISGEMIERSKNAVKNGSGVTARLHAGDGKKKQ